MTFVDNCSVFAISFNVVFELNSVVMVGYLDNVLLWSVNVGDVSVSIDGDVVDVFSNIEVVCSVTDGDTSLVV